MGAIVSPLIGDTEVRSPKPAVIEAPVDFAQAEEEAAAAARRAFLARRKRGREGTIATGARGILSPGELAVVRRSLLGG